MFSYANWRGALHIVTELKVNSMGEATSSNTTTLLVTHVGMSIKMSNIKYMFCIIASV